MLEIFHSCKKDHFSVLSYVSEQCFTLDNGDLLIDAIIKSKIRLGSPFFLRFEPFWPHMAAEF